MGGDLSSVVFKKFLITKRIQNSAEDRGTRKPSKYPESATPILRAFRLHMPQRHRIAGFAAVAERTGQGNATQKACSEGAAGKGMPQRHRIAGFAAVAER